MSDAQVDGAVPTLKFRWWSQKIQITAYQVRLEAARTNESRMTCKTRLSTETKPVLQQWFNAVAGSGEWRDVPFVVDVVAPAN